MRWRLKKYKIKVIFLKKSIYFIHFLYLIKRSFKFHHFEISLKIIDNNYF